MAETKAKPAGPSAASLKAKAKADSEVKVAKMHAEHLKAMSMRQKEHDDTMSGMRKEHEKAMSERQKEHNKAHAERQKMAPARALPPQANQGMAPGLG